MSPGFRRNEGLRDSDAASEGRLLAGILAAFLAVTVFAALDIWSDLSEGATASHVVSEAGVFLVGLFGSIFIVRRLVLTLRRARAARRDVLDLRQRLVASQAEANRWRTEVRELMSGLGEALDRQFDRWALSPAEKETALLLLKGLSHKEIAGVRSVSDATARQQARAVYKKAGLSGRHDLAAFFLEDLMLPLQTERGAGQR